MKMKRRRVLEVPPNIKTFTNSVIESSHENIAILLRDFVWEYDKGDFHHWIELFNHFDSFFEKCLKPRTDLQLKDGFLDEDAPFPKEAVLQILRVMRVILEKCANKHFNSSFEDHLSFLLASADADVVEASLQTMMAFLNKIVAKRSTRNSSLTSKLFALSQGWGAKEGGLGLTACCLPNGCDQAAARVGCALHFEFYDDSDQSGNPCDTNSRSKGLQIIHIPELGDYVEQDLELLHKLVKEHNVPLNLRFSLFTRLRFAKAFRSLHGRQQYTCIRLYAFIVLVQASHNSDELSSFLNNEPEFVDELLSLLSYEDDIPESIRILAILALVALCQDRAHQSTVLSSLTCGGQRGIIPSLMQKAVDSIINGPAKWSSIFVEALLSLISLLVSSTPGSLALQEAGLLPTILPLLNYTDRQHLHLVSSAVHVIEGFLDYNSPSSALFKDLGGLDDTIARLRFELLQLQDGSKKVEDSQSIGKGKENANNCSVPNVQSLCSETSISYNRKILLKALLRTISLATYSPGSSSRIDGPEGTVLPECLCTIFKSAKEFGGGVFSLAGNVMSDLIHKDPICFSILDAVGLPKAFIDAVLDGVLCNSEALICVPICLDALCLNSSGLQLVRDSNVLRCFVKIFTSKSYLKALNRETAGALSGGLDELMRHASSLRSSGVDMLIEILSTIVNIGSGSESHSSSETQCCSAPVPMEAEAEWNALHDQGESSQNGSPGQLVDVPCDVSSVPVESFLHECINNTAHLLETVLQNSDTCRIFIEKKGIESVLKLFALPLMPVSISVGQSISSAFKSFSPQHSISLAKTLHSFFREHLKLTIDLLSSISGTKLSELESERQMPLLRSLSILEGVLTLSSFLLKGTSSMISELAVGEAGVLKELGNVYMEITWQISLLNDRMAETKQVSHEKEVSMGDASVSNSVGRESDDDASAVPVVRYMNPLRNSVSRWMEQDIVSVVRSAASMQQHGRHSLSRIRGGRLSRQLDASHVESDGLLCHVDSSSALDVGKKSPDVLLSELLSRLALSIRIFLVTLVKGLPARRRTDSNLSPASKVLLSALGQFFLSALSYSGRSVCGFEMSLKGRYLGKVVEDMSALTFDSRRRVCNAALVNSFYANGAFKELLTTFEATSHLLGAFPLSIPSASPDQGSTDGKVCHSPWLMDTLQSYCKLLDFFVNSSLLLTTSLAQSQFLVQPIVTELTINLFPIPRDPEAFVRMLQFQVLEALLPVWNHLVFPKCSPSFITSVISILTHIYAGVGNTKNGRSGLGSNIPRMTSPPLDESTVTTIVEMGFSRARAEEALRSVGTNSVEMATDWLFSHPEELVQEEVQLARALALSLGSSGDTPKEDVNDKNTVVVENTLEIPLPLDDILAVSVELFHAIDSLAFPLTDLIVTLCNRDGEKHRPKIVAYLIQQLKLCPQDNLVDSSVSYPIAHILALLLNEESSLRGLFAESGLASVVLDHLNVFKARMELTNEVPFAKLVCSLFLILNSLLQFRSKFSTETTEGALRSFPQSSAVDTAVKSSSSAEMKSDCAEPEKISVTDLESILGRSTGYLTFHESQRTLTIACEFIKKNAPSNVMQAVLQLCARLTKTHALAVQFLENGSLSALFSLTRNCLFSGYDTLASSIVRHIIEDPQTLQSSMEMEIKQALSGNLHRHSGRHSTRLFLTSMAPLICRDPAIFMKASVSVCRIDSSGGRMSIVLLKEKEKDKEKLRQSNSENNVLSGEPVRLISDKTSDIPSKCVRNNRKVPVTLSQVIEQILGVIMSHHFTEKHDTLIGPSSCPMEVDEVNAKGKSKVDDLQKSDSCSISERSASIAKITFILKLLSDIILMYGHAVAIVLRHDVEVSQARGSAQEVRGQTGLIHHALHQLLPLFSDKSSDTSGECNKKLSEKASWFLVVLCGRSTEGRRRVISETVKAFNLFLSSTDNTSRGMLKPDKKLLAFAELVHFILSRNSSPGSLSGLGCSPDVAKSMIEGGMVQSLSGLLKVIDLDHPDSAKLVNLILKALESLTKAANASNEVLKLDGSSKARSSVQQERTEGSNHGEENTAPAVQNLLHNGAVQFAEQQTHEAPQNETDSQHPHAVQSMLVDRVENFSTAQAVDHVEFMHEGADDGSEMPNDSDILAFPGGQQPDDEMIEEDDDDMGDEGEEEDEDEGDDEEDDDIAEDRAGLMSLVDTDVEDQENNIISDEYNDDVIDDEEDDLPEDDIVEVRWREGLSGIDHHLRQPRRQGDSRGFVDITEESFQGIVDGVFDVHRPFGIGRHQHGGNRSFLDRPRSEGNAFQHPVLARPSQARESVSSIWSSSASSSRDVQSLSFGGFDIPHLYMLDSGLSSDASASLFGDRAVGAPRPLGEFSFGIQSHIAGRRGLGDSWWTDDGQPQSSSHAVAIAQAVENQFVSQLSAVDSLDNHPTQIQPDQKENTIKQQKSLVVLENQAPVVGINYQPSTSPSQVADDAVFLEVELPAGVNNSIDVSSAFVIEEETRTLSDQHNTVNYVEVQGGLLNSAPVQIPDVPVDALSASMNCSDHPMADNYDVPACTSNVDMNVGAQSDIESRSSCHALISSASVLPEISDANADSVNGGADVDMNYVDVVGNQTDILPASNGDSPSIPQEPVHSSQLNANNESSSTNEIDPTFLEALPEDLRAEVLASQQNRSVETSTYAPPIADEIDPEFLAALPPDIQAEVLAQQRAQRATHSQPDGAQPVDMDNASIIATFPPNLREEVLLTSSEAVLSALPSALLAEAQMLRDRELNRYRARGSLFGGSYRISRRRLAVDNQSAVDRGISVNISRRLLSSGASNSKGKDIEGKPILDSGSLKAFTRLLHVAQPLSKGLLQRLLLNLCAHSITRCVLVGLLLDMVRYEADCFDVPITMPPHRLYGCQWNVVYTQPQSPNGFPPIVSRNLLEILTFLARNHSSVADLLCHFDAQASSVAKLANNFEEESTKEKEDQSYFETSSGCSPLLLFIKLLKKPLFLRSRVHLEQVLSLVEVVVNNAISKLKCIRMASGSSCTPSVNGYVTLSDNRRDFLTPSQEVGRTSIADVPQASVKSLINYDDILAQLPECELCNLCSILALEGLPDKVYSLSSEVVKKLSSATLSHQKFFSMELAGLARRLSSSAIAELVTLRHTQMLGLNSGSMAGAAMLRVLQALSTLTLDSMDDDSDVDMDQEEQSILWDLNTGLEPLWEELSNCISAIEARLGQGSSSTLSEQPLGTGEIGVSSAPFFPPGTHRLLPFIESFFVLCEKLRASHLASLPDSNVTAREIKDFAGCSSSPSLKGNGNGNITFAKVAEKHRRLLNGFIRQNPSLLEKSFSMMLKVPRLIDFDNKRAYFRSRIRQQNDQHLSAPLRVSVRRAYVLEDSYNQLRLRRSQDLRGRLTVQFQGEEGIDAGGLTREWYQILSRVIFDKGTLLFTTVGNNASFQPNPNSVYQTEHLSYFKFVGRVVAKALYDNQLLDVHFTRSFYKHILGVKVTYHDIEAVDPDYYKNLKWMLENDVSDIPDLTFSMDPDEEKQILYEKNEVKDYELKPGGSNIRVTEETKHEYVDLVAEHILTTAIRPQINAFLDGFTELVPKELISIFNSKELELLISGLPEIDIADLKENTEYIGYTTASSVIQWFWEVIKGFNKEDMARLLQFVTGTSKVPLEGFKALQGISGPQKFQIHKAYGAPERLPSAHTCFNQLDLPEYSSKEHLKERLLLAIHEASEGFGFG